MTDIINVKIFMAAFLITTALGLPDAAYIVKLELSERLYNDWRHRFYVYFPIGFIVLWTVGLIWLVMG